MSKYWFFSSSRSVLDGTHKLLSSVNGGSVGQAEHTPLTWLQSTGTVYLLCLFELRVNPCHHSQQGEVRETRQYLSDSSLVHTKMFEDPISTADGVYHTCHNEVSG